METQLMELLAFVLARGLNFLSTGRPCRLVESKDLLHGHVTPQYLLQS
jgi:hypothetical protein